MAPTPTPDQYLNATSSVSNSFASATDLGPVVLLIAYALTALVAAQFVAPWLARSRLLSSLGGGLLSAIVYALKGVATTAVLAVIALPAWFVSTLEPGTRSMAVEAVGIALGVLAALVVIGYMADRAVARFIDAHPDYESWGDIFGGEDDDVGEAEVAD